MNLFFNNSAFTSSKLNPLNFQSPKKEPVNWLLKIKTKLKKIQF